MCCDNCLRHDRSSCAWRGASLALGADGAQDLLRVLNQTALHLMAAGNAALTAVGAYGDGPLEKGVGASVAVCCGALFAWADAVVRGSELAAARHLRAFPGKVCPTGLGSDRDFGGITALLHPTAPILELRDRVLSYWHAACAPFKHMIQYSAVCHAYCQFTTGV
jgi:hypothetical protein